MYDLAVIGAGPAGYLAAIKAARLGMKTVLIEKGELGGVCLNKGCIPTKIFVHSAKLYNSMQKSGDFGIDAGSLSVDFDSINSRKNKIISDMQSGISSLLKIDKLKLIKGTAKVLSEGKIAVTEPCFSEIGAENILIATGSRPYIPKIDGINLPGVITSDDLTSGFDNFKSLVIIGGGVIGVEFAFILNSYGVDVTIVEAESRLLPGIDKEVSQNLSLIMKKSGIKLFLSSTVESINKGDSLICSIKTNKETLNIACDRVLVSVGRAPNTGELFDKSLDIKIKNGIITDDSGMTSIENIYAAGDVTAGGVRLAHYATAQGLNIIDKITCSKPSRSTSMSYVPSCIYTSPEIASAGITSDWAKDNNVDFVVGKYVMSSNPMNIIESSQRSFVKLIFEAGSLKLLGGSIVCDRATDMIGIITMALVNNLTAYDMRDMIYAHPTFYEGIYEAIEDALGGSLQLAFRKR
ncbi:MAG: dihydrolipoyl dehydrogenase [Ruminococcaceae bacterium]|nr:dihydrolipoyl dehydrogenase [Oscillospiraceae bacterium]